MGTHPRINVYGHINSERALKEGGIEFASGPLYQRSISLHERKIDPPTSDRVSWVQSTEIGSGYFEYDHADFKSSIRPCRVAGARFPALTLEKVNNILDGDGDVKITEDFYPSLYRILRDNKPWTVFKFRGQASFQPLLYEWTELTLNIFDQVLRQADIYGAVAASRYPYDRNPEVWCAFCELWGAQSNTLHTGAGEVGISLYDLKLIAGLPISGIFYEEFIPSNEKILSTDKDKQSTCLSMVRELLKIHSEISSHFDLPFIKWSVWIEYFYRGPLLYSAFGESSVPAEQKSVPHSRKRPMRTSAKESKTIDVRKLPLKVSEQGELAAYLSLWLSRFVLPHGQAAIRPETFFMASMMAQGMKVSLAPVVLGSIYHAMGEIATCPDGPGGANPCFPSHYVTAWLAEHFPCICNSRFDSEFPPEYLQMVRYAGMMANRKSKFEARVLFRHDCHFVVRPTSFPEDEDINLVDQEGLSDDRFDLLVSMRSGVLPIRIGSQTWLEPYYPNRFSRQFGYDQGVPCNKLRFSLSQRRNRGIDDLAIAWQSLLKRNTGAYFTIPRMSRMGTHTWYYVRWWVTNSSHYLGRSMRGILSILIGTPFQPPENFVYVVRSLREVSTGMKGVVHVSSPDKGDGHPEVVAENQIPSSMDSTKKHGFEEDRDINFKRARYHRPEESDNEYAADSANETLSNDVLEVPPLEIDKSGMVLYDSPIEISSPAPLIVITEEQACMASTNVNDVVEKKEDASDLCHMKTTGAFLVDFESRVSSFALAIIQDISKGIMSSTPRSLSSSQPQIKKAIDILNAMIDQDEDRVKKFTTQVQSILEHTSHLMSIKEKVRKGCEVDTVKIQTLVKRHRDGLRKQEQLSGEIGGAKETLSSHIRELQNLESDIAKAEERLRSLKERHVAKVQEKEKLQKKVNSLSCDLKDCERNNESLKHARSKAGEEKLRNFESMVKLRESLEIKFNQKCQSFSSYIKKGN